MDEQLEPIVSETPEEKNYISVEEFLQIFEEKYGEMVKDQEPAEQAVAFGDDAQRLLVDIGSDIRDAIVESQNVEFIPGLMVDFSSYSQTDILLLFILVFMVFRTFFSILVGGLRKWLI